jgi:protein TonB
MRTRNFHGRTRKPVAIVIAIATLLGACSKGEPEQKQSRPTPITSATAPATGAEAGKSAADASAGASAYAPSEALKERLARQAAAEKLFSAATPEPARSRAPEAKAPPAPAAKAPEPAKVAAARPVAAESAKATPPASAAAVEAPPPAPAKTEAPKPEAASAPRTEVAAAKPAAAAPAATRLIRRVEPVFPREAVNAGVYEGTVVSRLTLDASGNVTRVEVVEARPRRLFDRAVIRALSDWKYSEGASNRTVEVEVAFKAQ